MTGIASKLYLNVLLGATALLMVQPVFANETKRAQVDLNPRTNTAADLMTQSQSNITRVTGIEVNQTESGLELILKTVAGSERLVPLILPEGNDLVIDLLDATLGFSIRDGVTKVSPAPGIDRIELSKVDASSIRLTIAGESTTPSAEVVPSRQDLVLNISPEQTTAQQAEPTEEINIVVTEVGTRTATDPQDIPQTIQIIPQDVIENRQTNNITETLRSVPGIIADQGPRGQFSDVLIRGFFADYRRNGLREANSQASGVQTANIDRIEVLKGPASVLYGQGSFGGTVNLITKQPTDEPFYQVNAAIGNYDLYRGEVDLSGPLNESKSLKYRLNLAAETAGSFVDFYDRDRYQIAPVLSWQIGENTDITFEAEYSNYSGNTDTGLPASGTILDNPNGEIPLDRFLPDPDTDREDTEFVLASYNLEHRFSDKWRIKNAFQFTSRLNDAFLTFQTELQEDGRTLELISNTGRNQFDIYDYLLDTYVVGNFNTGSIKHELVTGVELNRSDFIGDSQGEGDRSPIDLFDPDYDNIVFPSPEETFEDETRNQTLGIYLQDKVEFSDSLTLLAGGRFDIVNNRFEDLTFDTVEFNQDEEFSPRVGIVYKPIPQLSLYGSYSRSFVANFFGRSEDGELFDPQRGTQYEIGAKAELNEKISVTLAYFDLTITNVLTEDDDNPAFSVQTGEQNSKGVELFASGEVLPGWNIFGGYVYNDATVTEDNVIPVGNRLNNVPEHAISLSTNYEIQQGNLKGLGAGLGIYFVGERQGDLENTFEVPSYTRTDASIFYNRDKFKTALNFRNLFDIDYFESAQTDLRVRPGEPLTVIGSVSYEF